MISQRIQSLPFYLVVDLLVGKTHQWFILACDIAGNNDNVCSSTCYSIRQIHSALINDSKKSSDFILLQSTLITI